MPPTLTCPHCRAISNFTSVHTWQVNIQGRGGVKFGVFRCDACNRPVTGEWDGIQLREYVPRSTPKGDFPDVPTPIAENAKEAYQCASVEGWRATAAMARRALQAAAYEKGAPDKKLIEQIDWLADNGVIPGQMKEVAHQIRLGGNIGAHPDKDGLRDIGEAEAKAILQFLDDFFRYVYEIPASLGRLSQGTTTSP